MSYLLSEQDFNMGGGGTFAITTGAAVPSFGFYMLRVDADAVFDELEINGNGADVRTAYLDSAGATIAAGTWIVAGETNYFSNVDLASGKVTGFKVPSNLQ
jgi:hypothetical protein